MKKIIFIFSALFILSSCKKATLLDNTSNNALNEETVFADSVNTVSFLTRIYQDMGFTFKIERYNNGNTEQATDDSEYTLLNPERVPLALYTSNYTADRTKMLAETYILPYANIRRVNLLLSKLPGVPFHPSTKRRVAAEARFLRAWYYYNLFIAFGGTPIIGDKVFAADETITIPRSTFAESVNYVVSELDETAPDLPTSYSGNDYGRITRGAALALKTKMLLFAASPLFNGNTWAPVSGDPYSGIPMATRTPERIALAGYPDFDVTRWNKVLDAAVDVIGLGQYQLYEDANSTRPGFGFYSLFLQRRNPEHILYVMRPPNRDVERVHLPGSRNGQMRGNPTQNLVDAFPMKDGKSIAESTSYKPQDPYTNRDPRFYFSIIYNGAPYLNPSTNAVAPVFTFVGSGGDGFTQSSSSAGPSGYFGRKMADENVTGTNGNANRNWHLIRFAEILLIKAEALNELNRTTEAYEPLKEIRRRAGIEAGASGNYGMKTNMTQVEMRNFIQNERRIELYGEDKRWDDVRRWKLATKLFNGYNKVMKPTKVTVSAEFPTGYKYEVINSLFLHTFNERNYLFPFETGEMQKNTALIQNPGW